MEWKSNENMELHSTQTHTHQVAEIDGVAVAVAAKRKEKKHFALIFVCARAYERTNRDGIWFTSWRIVAEFAHVYRIMADENDAPC